MWKYLRLPLTCEKNKRKLISLRNLKNDKLVSKSKKLLQNKKAKFNYEIIEKIEAGVVLNGPEVKAVRDGKLQLTIRTQ